MMTKTTMNNPLLIAGVVLVVITVIVILLVIRKARGRTMSASSRKRIGAAWAQVTSLTDPVRRVMEADKVLDLTLTEAGYAGTLGDKLKKAGPRFSDVDAVWHAHKLRNTLAHESGAQVNEKEAANALRTFERAIRDLC